MTTYCILPHPNTLRIYGARAEELLCKELSALLTYAGCDNSSVCIVSIEQLNYFCFESSLPLSKKAAQAVRQFSAAYALYYRKADALVPIALSPQPGFPGTMSAMLKYTGKTNELFTRLMINLAISAANTANTNRLCLYDPMCGKGTTLYEGLSAGLDVYGCEVHEEYYKESCRFLSKFMEIGRYKHRISKDRVCAQGGRELAQITTMKCSIEKSAFDTDPQIVKLACGDTCQSDQFFKKRGFDLLVTDLPYGVQHGSRAAGKGSRSPAKLLAQALPVWRTLLRPGGAVVLSFNTLTLDKETLVVLLAGSGYIVLKEPPYDEFYHRVEQAINRDLIVATIP